ncbi:hypothetical protein C4D60_Mb06t16520 [Musa balbisiana]|uniref:Uncharacterized protein n=1 Tax=Musa balbisiana TaxID=52838 RepID=A0A4S8INP1_MUSBA|nr:hypothetical protein C4D60_Mb06t16520 [Musa balbisiana]
MATRATSEWPVLAYARGQQSACVEDIHWSSSCVEQFHLMTDREVRSMTEEMVEGAHTIKATEEPVLAS